MKRVAIYTRKSTSIGLEKDFNSLEAQREACTAYAKSQGWEVVGTYEDGGFTGANIERPGFRRLLADVDAKKVDLVVVYKVDRLSRSLLDFAKLMDRFDKAGAAFVSVTQHFSTADAMGRLTLNILMSFAEFEREMIAERTRDKIAASRRRGKWTGGQVPLGYDVKEGKLVVNELEAITVREAFDVYIRTRSILSVMRHLRAEGRMPKDHVSKKGKRRTTRTWTQHTLLRILRNPVYAGLTRAGNDLVPGEHTAILDRATFDAAQVRKVATGGRRDDRYLLRGLLRCACGAALVPATATKGNRYYRCSRRDKEGPESCTMMPLVADRIEPVVLARLRDVGNDPALVERVSARLEQRLGEARGPLEIERRALPGRIAGLSAEARRATEALAKANEATRSRLEGLLESVLDELAKAEARLRAVGDELRALDAAKVESEWVTRTLQNFEAIWSVLTPENRLRLMHAAVARVTIDSEAGIVRTELREVA